MQNDPQTHAGPGAVETDPVETQTPLEDGWLHELDDLPPRPRRRLLSPAPLALLGVLLTVCGFIAGVLVEKGQGAPAATSTAASAFASRFAAGAAGAAGGRAAGATGATAAGSAAGVGGAPGAAGGTRPTSGTVSYTSGGTLYVTTGEGNTVEVKTTAATAITKTSKSTAHAIHPGETVTITGASGSNGTIDAEAIRVGASGFAGAFGGRAGGGSGASQSTSTSGGPALFGGG